MADMVLSAIKKARDARAQVAKASSEGAGDGTSDGSDGLDYSLAGVFDDSAQEDTFGDGVSLTHGEWPEAMQCKSWDTQFHRVSEWIAERLRQDASAKPEGICVIVRDNQHVDDWMAALRGKTSYGALKLDNNAKDSERTPGIRVATVYRAKGLEFDYVVVPDVDQCPPSFLLRKCAGDKAALQALIRQERNLLYVAMTRPRKELLVTAVR